MSDHAAKRPFPLTPEPTHPWEGVHKADPTRDGTSPNSTILGEPFSQPPAGFADGGLVGSPVTPLPSPGGALQPQLLADGGKVGKKGNKDKLDPEDLGSGLLADAATDLTGRELQVENQIRAAEGLPPLKTKK